MTFRSSVKPLIALMLLASSQETRSQSGPVAVTLTPTTSPAAGEPGVTNISVTGSGFPTGTILAANVTISLKPSASGAAVTTPATTIATVAGSTRRASFTVPASVQVSAPTAYTVSLSGTTSTGVAFASTNTAALTINPVATLTSVNPNTGQAGQSLTVAITGSFSNFLQGATAASFGAGITVNSTTVASATQATANLTIASTAAAGPRTVTMTTGVEIAALTNGFSVTAAGPTISDFNPKSGSAGTLVTITGTNLQPASGTAAQVSVAKQGGGTLVTEPSGNSSTSLSFVIPAGATTGVVGVSVNGGNAGTAGPLTVVPVAGFTLTANPPAPILIQGQSVSYSVQLSSTNGFNQLAQLSVTGVPSGITTSFNPPGITTGQTSILTLSAPATQPTATANLSITASATVGGLQVSQSVPVSVMITAPTTSFLGRTVVSNSAETPLAGVTIKTLGQDGNGNTTGCTSHATTSDAAGNFLLTNLPAQCTGPQLIGYDGTTATSPPGQYAGVNLVYTLVSGQVTPSPVLVHLPRIDNQQTFYVQQNAATTQTYAWSSIPGLSVIVYPGTTFTMPDGTQPNPFPLIAVQVPTDRLPDLKPSVPTMLMVFIVAFQPADATTNQPVAVYFPNTINAPTGEDMPLLTLDPTHGSMVPYGTGAVSSDGTQIVPDSDPSHPGHLYGLVHFDWHGPMPAPPPQNNPAPPGSGVSSGAGPGGGPGAGPGGSSGAGNGSAGDNGGDNDGGTGTGTTGMSSTSTNTCNSDDLSGLTMAAVESADRRADLWANLNRSGASEPPYADDNRAEAGDPVDLSSGVQVLRHRDLLIQGSRGTIALVRTYRSLTTLGGPFGIGTSHNFNYGLDTAFPTLTAAINLIMPDGNRFLFSPLPCSGGGNCGKANTTIPALAGAIMQPNADNSTDLTWKNGTKYHFVPISFQSGSLLASITDANGNTISVARDSSGNVTSITDPVGRSLVFTHDASNRVTTITDPMGRTVQYTYNAQGSLSTFTDPIGGVTQYSYDSKNNLLQVIDAKGIVRIQNTLDSSGRVVQQIRADGGTLTFSYTVANPVATVSPILAATVTDSNGVQSKYRFSVNGFVTDVTNTQGQVRSLLLAAGSNLLNSVTEATATTNYTYDAIGNVLTSTDPTGLTTAATYGINSTVTSITDPLGNSATFTYDAKGNILTSTDADGNVTSYQHDSTGLVTQVTDPMNYTTKYSYDNYGNLASVIDPLGNTKSYIYDALSRLTQSIDALGRRTYFTYDALGRMLTHTDAKGNVTTFSYDSNGNLISVKDARGNINTFTYDTMNRLLTRTDALGRADTRTWDTNGNLVQYVDRRGVTSTFTYDNLNRLVNETYVDATVARTYDSLGRLNQVNDSAAGIFTFTADPTGRLLASTTPFGAVNYTYDGRGMLASRQVSGQPTLSYAYDPTGNLLGASMPQASASFAYDARNELSAISRQNGVRSVYSYDPDARLLGITHTSGPSNVDVETYSYDAIGNRGTHSSTLGQPLITQPTSNQFDVANQLTLFGSTPNSYDGNGNLIEQGTSVAYTFDGRNRLKSIVTAAGQTTNFTYDFMGNLIRTADSGTSLNLTKVFLLDDLTNVAYEVASDGSSYSVLSGRGIDSHFAVLQSSGQTQYRLTDAINSTVMTVDQTGSVNSQFYYDPFGQSKGASTYPFQFTGRMPVSGSLLYYRARYYDTSTGRFISQDRVPSASSLYEYASNSPAMFTDPLGLDVFDPPELGGPPGGPLGNQIFGQATAGAAEGLGTVFYAGAAASAAGAAAATVAPDVIVFCGLHPETCAEIGGAVLGTATGTGETTGPPSTAAGLAIWAVQGVVNSSGSMPYGSAGHGSRPACELR